VNGEVMIDWSNKIYFGINFLNEGLGASWIFFNLAKIPNFFWFF
jgi:hypothetical protein